MTAGGRGGGWRSADWGNRGWGEEARELPGKQIHGRSRIRRPITPVTRPTSRVNVYQSQATDLGRHSADSTKTTAFRVYKQAAANVLVPRVRSGTFVTMLAKADKSPFATPGSLAIQDERYLSVCTYLSLRGQPSWLLRGSRRNSSRPMPPSGIEGPMSPPEGSKGAKFAVQGVQWWLLTAAMA